LRKRVGVGQGLGAEPKVILFDEPTTGLDPVMTSAINTLIKEPTPAPGPPPGDQP
jgi:phospholipid/cholesterol/gamma-HCH transport system ATP-binding protein